MPALCSRSARRLLLAAGVCGAALAAAGPSRAQDEPDPSLPQSTPAIVSPTPILKLDQERLFGSSAYGKAVSARFDAETADLTEENRRLDAALEAEERALTERRAQMPPEEFAPLATAFDAKVEEIRAAQEAKYRAITRRVDEDRQRFFEAAVPVLGNLLNDTGAVAILADSAIILSLTTVDITDEAVARMDVVLPAPGPSAEPSPDAPVPPAPGPAAPSPLPQDEAPQSPPAP
jgi:Skp family chaperone for outer membrane proteins